MLKIRLSPGCIVISVLFVCGMLYAVETNAPAPPMPPSDYGRGFALFYKLGLPDARGGEYVALAYRSYGSSFFNGASMYSARQMKLKGGRRLQRLKCSIRHCGIAARILCRRNLSEMG